MGEENILKTLLTELQKHADSEEDKDLKTLFGEVRDELRTLNKGMGADRESKEEAKEVQMLVKEGMTALRSRYPKHFTDLPRPPR
jgi:hypothetical protein